MGDVDAVLRVARAIAAQATVAGIGAETCRAIRALTGAEVAFAVRDGDAIAYFAEDPPGCAAAWGPARREIVEVDDATALELVGGRRDARAIAEVLAGFATAALAHVRRFDAEVEARRHGEAAVDAKNAFLATLGHRLRNPLTPIVTALSIVKLRGPDPHEQERAIIERQVGELVRLAEALLDVSRLERGTLQLRRIPVEVCDVVTRALDNAGTLLEERQLAVAVPESGLPIDADFDRMTQVVMNLLSNAAYHTPRGGRIEVVADVEGSCARLVVRDDGAGIDGGLLPRLFDAFAVKRGSGLGLGLPIVRSLVELHGGVVSAASDGPGRGASFTIRLPLADA